MDRRPDAGEDHEPAGPRGAGPSRDLEDRVAALREELVRAVRRVCPGWIRSQADDLVQVALLRLLDSGKKSGGIEERGSSYLRMVAYSVTVDEIRRQYRRGEVTVGDGPMLDLTPSRRPGPEREARAREIDHAITDCLSGLIRPRRLVVTLHLQGYSVPDAARSLGWTTKRAEHLTYRGLADLRTCLDRKGVRP